MKATTQHRITTSALTTLAAALLAGSHAQAAISGIDASLSSASIFFDDTNSTKASFPGSPYSATQIPPWPGFPPLTLSVPIAATTFDIADGNINATWTALTYAINIPSALLQQDPGNLGFATLHFLSTVVFTTNAGGFAAQPTQMPTFFVDGTVQPGGSAFFNGSITYTSSTFPAFPELVNYGFQTANPTASPVTFSTSVTGLPQLGSTLFVAGGDTLTLVADFTLWVDPASIHVTTVPEPSSALLALLSLPLLLRRRRA